MEDNPKKKPTQIEEDEKQFTDLLFGDLDEIVVDVLNNESD